MSGTNCRPTTGRNLTTKSRKTNNYSLLLRKVMRSDGLEKRMMLAHGDERRRRGRPRRKWMDEIHEVTGMKLAELRDVTAERKHWRRMVKTVARTRRVDSTRNQGNLRFTVLLLHILGDTIVQLMTPSKVTADAPHRKIPHRYVIKRPDPPSLRLLRYITEMHLPPYTARCRW